MCKFYIEIQKQVSIATKDMESEAMAEVSDEEMGGSAYDRLEKALLSGLETLKEMREHKHDWNEEEYCSICGADGRA